jgi:hypothetical protein
MSAARQVLLDLADRCEREEPSTELDAAIGYAVDATPKAKNVYKRGHYIGNKPVLLRVEAIWLPYTTSLDAAVTLVPSGWSYRVGLNEGRLHAQAVLGRSYPTNATVTVESGSPALAICTAALRARAETL